MHDDHRARRIAGAGLALLVVGVFALTAAFYTRAFADPAEVVLVTDRAGLVMDPGNKVKYHGVEIGRVGSVEPDGDGVRLVLQVDRDEIDRIPADSRAQIRASTIFGAKYVEILQGRAAVALADGGRLAPDGVTSEVNTVFDSLDRVLSGVDVAQLNATLSVLSRTLAGRGEEISTIAAKADDYLTRLEPLLPQLRRDLLQVARFADLGVEVSPALIRILENATVTARTVSEQDAAVDRLLVNLSVLGGEATEFLGMNGDALATLLRTLRPTAETLRVYSTELPCLLRGLDNTRAIMAKVIGGTTSALRGLVSVRSELPAYTYPRDLPGVPKGTGPACFGLPRLQGAEVPLPERGDPR